MTTTSVHNPDRYMSDLLQILSQGRKRIGIFIGAGAPTAIRVDENNEIVKDGGPLVPDVIGLTGAVVDDLSDDDRRAVDDLKADIDGNVNVETILTQVRRLAEAIGKSTVHGLDGEAYEKLGLRICERIGARVSACLPNGANPYSELVSWISGTQRENAVEIFTPNYDLLVEEAFERARVPYFDGFTGSHKPFFDPASVAADELPARWARLWKLHGSLGWSISNDAVIRTGERDATELIYPDHLKYDRVTRLPYSALFERLRKFLTTPDTLLICTGFSFLDRHICAVLDEALAANAHTAILAFQYRALEEESSVAELAASRPNMSVYARDRAVIHGVAGRWRPRQPPNEDWRDIRLTFWREESADNAGEFLLGDFAKLAWFLKLTQAREMSTPASDQGETDSGEQDETPVSSEERSEERDA